METGVQPLARERGFAFVKDIFRVGEVLDACPPVRHIRLCHPVCARGFGSVDGLTFAKLRSMKASYGSQMFFSVFPHAVEGAMVYRHAGTGYLMKTADSLWFNAPHGPEAPVRLPIRFLCVIGCPRTTGAAPA